MENVNQNVENGNEAQTSNFVDTVQEHVYGLVDAAKEGGKKTKEAVMTLYDKVYNYGHNLPADLRETTALQTLEIVFAKLPAQGLCRVVEALGEVWNWLSKCAEAAWNLLKKFFVALQNCAVRCANFLIKDEDKKFKYLSF